MLFCVVILTSPNKNKKENKGHEVWKKKGEGRE